MNRYRKDRTLMERQRSCAKLFFMRQSIAQGYTMNSFQNHGRRDLRNEFLLVSHTDVLEIKGKSFLFIKSQAIKYERQWSESYLSEMI